MAVLSLDISGQKFGRLSAISMRGRNKHGVILWLWLCDCGKEIERVATPIKSGRVVSCGCHRNEQSRARTKHGQAKRQATSVTYRAWIEMKARTSGKDEVSRKHYQERGIVVHPAWEASFEAFWKDMGDCPNGLTLERID